METPAMLCEIGNSATVASLAEPAGPCQPVPFSMSYLKLGNGSNLVSAGAAPAWLAAADASATAPNTLRRLMPSVFRCFVSSAMEVPSLNAPGSDITPFPVGKQLDVGQVLDLPTRRACAP